MELFFEAGPQITQITRINKFETDAPKLAYGNILWQTRYCGGTVMVKKIAMAIPAFIAVISLFLIWPDVSFVQDLAGRELGDVGAL